MFCQKKKNIIFFRQYFLNLQNSEKKISKIRKYKIFFQKQTTSLLGLTKYINLYKCNFLANNKEFKGVNEFLKIKQNF